MSDLVEEPEDRFSHDVAHIALVAEQAVLSGVLVTRLIYNSFTSFRCFVRYPSVSLIYNSFTGFRCFVPLCLKLFLWSQSLATAAC